MWPIERRCQRRSTHAFVSPATIDLLADKAIGIISDRRMTKVRRYMTAPTDIPRLFPGLRLWHGGYDDAIRRRPGEWVSVSLANQSRQFETVSFGIEHHGETEEEIAHRYLHPEEQWLQQRRNITYVDLDGWPGQPASNDQIRIEHWNDSGVGLETILVFDDIDHIEELAWDIKGDRDRQVRLWDEFCEIHQLHYEHPDHERTGCTGRPPTLAENLDLLTHLARLKESGNQ